MKYKVLKSILVNMEHKELVKVCLQFRRKYLKLVKVLSKLPKEIIDDIKDCIVDYYGIEDVDFESISPDGYVLLDTFEEIKDKYKDKFNGLL